MLGAILSDSARYRDRQGLVAQSMTRMCNPLQVTRETGALLPTVCAMALLPAGPAGQAYAPAALRHLMTDPDSPVADLYQSCSVCEGLRKAESMATLALVEVSHFLRLYICKLTACGLCAGKGHSCTLQGLLQKRTKCCITSATYPPATHVTGFQIVGQRAHCMNVFLVTLCTHLCALSCRLANACMWQRSSRGPKL